MLNIIKSLELIVLGITFPICIVYLQLSKYIILFLWSIFLYTLLITLVLYTKEISLQKSLRLNFKKNKKYISFILARWLFLSLLLYFFTKIYYPDKLFFIQENNPTLLYKIFLLYPFLSAYPQEFIFCSFFFNRYRSLFKNDNILIFMSAVVFCFAHIFSINLVAPTLSFIGGLIFAYTFKKTGSLLVVSIEHALYGNTLFFLGLGWFFWGGSVSN